MEEKIKPIIRVVQTDIHGHVQLFHALYKIKGISYSLANAICIELNFDKLRPVGGLKEEEVKSIESLLENPEKLPNWMLNRRKDFDTGKDIHLTTAKLKLTKEFDIKRLQALKSYKGLRHAWNLPVRGQQTRSHFRKGRSVGVMKKSMGAQSSGDKKK